MSRRQKKHLTKEIFILVALLILIMLVLLVAMYEFIPTNLGIPEGIRYSSDSETTSVIQEIRYTNDDDDVDSGYDESLKSYSIESKDLTVYGEKNLYNSGNSDPFDYASEETVAPNGETNTPTGTTGTSSTETPSTNNTSTGTQSSGGATTGTNSGGVKSSRGTGSTTGTFFENSSSK